MSVFHFSASYKEQSFFVRHDQNNHFLHQYNNQICPLSLVSLIARHATRSPDGFARYNVYTFKVSWNNLLWVCGEYVRHFNSAKVIHVG